jgi:hypothetical protein
MNFTKIKHDVNGNPRYVIDFYHLLTDEESKRPLYDYQGRRITPTKYEIACKRANKIGGRKYHNKSYGGGIVFQSYSLPELENSIREIVAKENK